MLLRKADCLLIAGVLAAVVCEKLGMRRRRTAGGKQDLISAAAPVLTALAAPFL